MGKSRIARSRNPSHAATSSRAVSRTATADTSTKKSPRPRNTPSRAAQPQANHHQQRKKEMDAHSTPIQRPSGIDQPRNTN